MVILPVLLLVVERGKQRNHMKDTFFQDSDPPEAAGHRRAGLLSSKQLIYIYIYITHMYIYIYICVYILIYVYMHILSSP